MPPSEPLQYVICNH